MNYEEIYHHKDNLYYLHGRAELLPFVPAGIKTALDIGCGNGAFGVLLKEKFDCRVWGVEPNKNAAESARQNLEHVVNELFTRGLPSLANKKFDAIFFNDVLEHLPNPEDALVACRDLLNPNGCIIASIPNIRWYPAMLSLLRYKDFKYEKAGVMDKTHLRFFTLKSMYRIFEESGYTVHTAKGINKDSYLYFNILNFLLFNTQWDMKYPQFVIVAKQPGDAR